MGQWTFEESVFIKGPRPWVDVRTYGAKGDNATNDYQAFVDAITATPAGGTLYIPAPTSVGYLISGDGNTLTVDKHINVVCDAQGVLLRKTGTGHLLVLDGSVTALRGLHLRNLILATEGTAGDALRMRCVRGSVFTNIQVPSAVGAGIRMFGSLLNTFIQPQVSVNLTYTAGTRAIPTHGVSLEGGEAGTTCENQGCNANGFYVPIFEGIDTSPGYGINIDNGDGNRFVAGTSEGNEWGVRFGVSVHDNQLDGVYMEQNTSGDVTGAAADIAENSIINSVGASPSRAKFVRVQVQDGTLAEPSIGFRDDNDNGIHRLGADAWALIVAGAKAIELGATVNESFKHLVATSAVDLGLEARPWGNAWLAESLHAIPASPAQITANQNDYNPSNAGIWRLNSDASRNITGIGDGASGRHLTIINVGAQDIVLQNQNVGSVAANRIITGTGADVTLTPDDTAVLIYDDTTARWRIVAQ